MARPIVLSNGELHVGLNKYGLVHDFYFPYVGFENHAAGQSLRHRVGVWVDGALSWLDDDEWSLSFSYPHTALIGHTVATHEGLGIMLEFDDFVDNGIDAFMRSIHIINLRDTSRDVRLFMHQAFVIGDSRSNTDTVQYLPGSDAILHYRGRRAFVVSGMQGDKPFDQYTVGLFGIEGREGTYRDADDGELSFANVEHGRVDSTIRFATPLEAHGSARVSYWIAAGTSTREALSAHQTIQEEGVSERMHHTAAWWHAWLRPALAIADKIRPDHRDSFIRSIMIVKSQIDKRGAVIASTDTTMLNYSRDAYGYSWPRDGAYALWPLIRIGYIEEALRFFEFCVDGLHPNGYLMHKYRADGALGSSWHPYVHEDGDIAPPIQEDETSLTLFVYAQFHQLHPGSSQLNSYYDKLVKPMATFLVGNVEPATGLPKASYDLWEQTFATFTYTTALTYAALQAAAELAEETGDKDSAVTWRSTADDILTAAHKQLYNNERHVFYKSIRYHEGTLEKDATVDMSSIFGAFMFGLFPSNSPELTSSVQTVHELFGLNDGAIGVPRFENDGYRRSNPSITGNLWFIASLWLAQYHIEHNETERAFTIIDWVRDSAEYGTMFAEQYDPSSNTSVAPAPLTWSHAEYIATLLDTITEA